MSLLGAGGKFFVHVKVQLAEGFHLLVQHVSSALLRPRDSDVDICAFPTVAWVHLDLLVISSQLP